MEVLIYLVPLALMLGLLGLAAFLWSLKSGQYDDLDGAAWRAIMDDDEEPRPMGRAQSPAGSEPPQRAFAQDNLVDPAGSGQARPE
jgi:cbb3-type cytochrome oxidase maturation protein